MTLRLSGVLALTALVAGACGSAAEENETTRAVPERSPEPIASFVPRCVDGDFDRQRHGATCLCCHEREFGVAGSVDPAGPPVARVVVYDARGDVATMAPNSFSNFFRHFTMTSPFRAVAYGPDGRAAWMRQDAPSADCNTCHYAGGPVGLIHGP
jgi:hypothetical protein